MTDHDPNALGRLPQMAAELALRLGADPDAAFERVSFSQTGKMRISLTSKRWLPFTARQTMAVRSCAFTWRARFLPLGYMTVIDALENGVGRLNVSALGVIPVVRTKPNAALTRGELIRYLAELPLAPDAMLHNRDLGWREINASTLAVIAGAGETACEVIFTLGPDLRIASAFCANRAAGTTPPFALMPWRGQFFDYRQQRGRWIPSVAQVGWEIDGEEDAYWRGRIEHWEALADNR
jgi:hypothetical protein